MSQKKDGKDERKQCIRREGVREKKGVLNVPGDPVLWPRKSHYIEQRLGRVQE